MVRKSRSLLALAAAACWMPATSAQEPPFAAGGPGMMGGPGMGMPPGMMGGPPGMPPGGGLGAALGQYYQGGPGDIGAHPPAHGQFPGDKFGPQRFQMPTLDVNRQHAGGGLRNEVVRPDSETIGIRLDSSYTLIREIEMGGYFSEKQAVGVFGGTFLPFQAPGWIMGVRSAVAMNGNNSVTADLVGATTDLFVGTRYKHSYLKLGFLGDYTTKNQVYGATFALLTRAPLIGNMTLDTAVSSGSGSDDHRPPADPLTGRFQRIEGARNNVQVRVGKFITNWFQTGISASVSNFRFARDEHQYGVWANHQHGGKTFGWEVAGGHGGLRGQVTLGLNWGGGRNIDLHPIDTGYDNPIDTVSWVTKAPRRDPTIRLRTTNTGDPPPQSVAITQ